MLALLATTVTLMAPYAQPCEDGGADLLASAALAPPDVRVFAHVAEPTVLRDELARFELGDRLAEVLESPEMRDAWGELARRVGTSRETLFDACLGRSATLMVRGHGPTLEWAIASEVAPAVGRALPEALDLQARGPRSRVPVFHLPEHELLIALARRGELFIAASEDGARLFDDVLRCVGDPGMPSLADMPVAARLRELGEGTCAIVARHDRPLGAWTASVVAIDGEAIVVRQLATFDEPGRHATAAIDVSPLEALDDRTVLAVIEPAREADAARRALASAVACREQFDPPRPGRAGGRFITAICDASGRPSLALCVELAEARTDDDLAPAPRGAAWTSVQTTLTRSLGGPMACELVRTPGTTWGVMSSDPMLLESVAGALRAPRRGAPAARASVSAGSIHGRRLAPLLRQWGRELDRVTGEALLDPLCTLAETVERARWTVSPDEGGRVLVELRLELAPADPAP